MIKSEKQPLVKELEEKKKVVGLRVQSIEKQAKLIEKRVIELRREINDAVIKGQTKNSETRK